MPDILGAIIGFFVVRAIILAAFVIIIIKFVQSVAKSQGGRGTRRNGHPHTHPADEWRAHPFNIPHPPGANQYGASTPGHAAVDNAAHTSHTGEPGGFLPQHPLHGHSHQHVDSGVIAAAGLGAAAAAVGIGIAAAVDSAQNWSQSQVDATQIGNDFTDNSAYAGQAVDTSSYAPPSFDLGSMSSPTVDTSSFSTPSFDTSSFSSPSVDTSSFSSPSVDTSSSGF